MNESKLDNIKILNNIVTIWDDLAESGLLIDMMHEILLQSEDNEEKTERLKRIYTTLYLKSEEYVPEVEQYFAEMYINHLQHFLDRVQQCKNQKQ